MEIIKGANNVKLLIRYDMPPSNKVYGTILLGDEQVGIIKDDKFYIDSYVDNFSMIADACSALKDEYDEYSKMWRNHKEG